MASVQAALKSILKAAGTLQSLALLRTRWKYGTCLGKEGLNGKFNPDHWLHS